MTEFQHTLALDYKSQIMERVERWISSFTPYMANEEFVSESLIQNFYEDTCLAPFDSCGHFRSQQLPQMIGKSTESFLIALRRLDVRVVGPFNESVIEFQV